MVSAGESSLKRFLPSVEMTANFARRRGFLVAAQPPPLIPSIPTIIVMPKAVRHLSVKNMDVIFKIHVPVARRNGAETNNTVVKSITISRIEKLICRI